MDRATEVPAVRESGFTRQKLPDLIVDEIKRWIVASGMRPSDRLPQERQLMKIFGVSKGTVRESLRSLEVQGMVRINSDGSRQGRGPSQLCLSHLPGAAPPGAELRSGVRHRSACTGRATLSSLP